MASVSEEIAARKAKYDRVEYSTDTLGRVIGVKKLPFSKVTAVRELAPALESGNSMGSLIVAAAVCEIDGVKVMFPQSRMQLDAILDRLDEEGLTAAGIAYAAVMGIPLTGGEDQEKRVSDKDKAVDQTKN